MHQLALVILDSRNFRPFEIVQDATCIDEKFCFIFDNIATGQVANSELPDAFGRVPLGMFDLVLELDVLVDKVVFLVDSFKVFEYFG